jgi:hypothetical protein
MTSTNILDQDLLRAREVARILDVHPDTPGVWRRSEVGPPYVRINGRYYYPKDAFEAWLQERQVRR